MAIVDLLKTIIIGPAGEKETILEGLQELGILHLTSLKTGFSHAEFSQPTPVREARAFLGNCSQKRHQIRDAKDFDAFEIAEETLLIRDQTRILEDERDQLVKRIKDVEPWGDFHYPSIEEMEGLRLWFYIVPLYKLGALEEMDMPWEAVARDNIFAYVVAISEAEPDKMPVPRIHTGDKPLSWLRNRLTDIEEELEDLRWRRIGLTKWLHLLETHLADADNLADLAKAARAIFDDGELFIVEAWAPESKYRSLEEYARENGLILTTTPPGPDDEPPTLLANPPKLRGGEDLVRLYTTPAYGLWDPSATVFFAFTVFFAMIISDAGYGAVLGCILLATRKRCRRSAPGLYYLFVSLILATIGYGILAGSYFGLTPPANSFINHLRFLDVQNRNQMMSFSIVLGALHLMLAHFVTLYRAEKPLEKIPPFGWLMILTGGLLLWSGEMEFFDAAFSNWSGRILLITGCFLILAFSSQRPFRASTWKDQVMRFLEGLVALTGISRAFGDILSYLRLFALGLASAQLAITFNSLAADAKASMAGVGTLAAIVILLLGHGLNFLLAVMSGVVHGLRLNYIEFFNWGLPREGYPFKPFQKRRIASWSQSS